MDDFSNAKLGYAIAQENYAALAARSSSPTAFCSDDFDPADLEAPIGMIDLLDVQDQAQINCCTGEGFTTCAEEAILFETDLKDKTQLSPMFAYINGQKHCGIRGDNGATLEGVIAGAEEDGTAEEKYCKFTGQYFTSISADAKDNAKKHVLKSYSPLTTTKQIYQGLAKRVGGVFIGIPCTQDIFNSPADGILKSYTSYGNEGGHAMAIVDWCEERDSNNWPLLLLANSWGRRYGYRGFRKCYASAVASMLRASKTFYLLSDMGQPKPRWDWKANRRLWAA